jgi:hypothetical protein
MTGMTAFRAEPTVQRWRRRDGRFLAGWMLVSDSESEEMLGMSGFR